MSIVNNKSFPNTSFPDSTQQLKTFRDLSEDDKANYLLYLRAIIDKNYELANTYKSNISSECTINANDLNILSDTISAIQEMFSSSSVFSQILNNKQQEWLNKISEFRYEGVWTAPRVFSSATSYTAGSTVLYNNKIWKRTSKTSRINPIPSTSDGYWENAQRKNAMVKARDYDSGRDILYIAIEDISDVSAPYYNSNWVPFTLIGVSGSNGSGFTFNNEWSASVNYSVGNLVIYNNNCYSSLRNSNINHIPTSNTDWWKHEFYIGVNVIPVQSERPSGQINGDIWFQTLE